MLPGQHSWLLQYDDTTNDEAADDSANNDTADDDTADDDDPAADAADPDYDDDNDTTNDCGERRESARITLQLLWYRKRRRPGLRLRRA